MALVTVSAASRLMTCSPIDFTGSTVRSLCAAAFTRVGLTFLPWLSSVAYTLTMSRVEAPMVPRDMAGVSPKSAPSFMPRARAVFLV